MRTFTRLFSLLLIFIPSIIWANVIVHGKLRYTNGVGVAGVPVHVVGDSALAVPGACYQTHIRYTDALGSYTDTLVCNTNMSQVLVWIMNCNGTVIRQNFTLSAAQNVESNFVFCDSTINQCHATFTWQASNLEAHFFSGGSGAGNPSTDSISTRTWTFGDGTSFNGNTINPVHLYTQAGTYTVCLKIRTYSGCENTYCSTIQITNITCAANFTWERIISTNRVRFNSSSSTATTPDSIVSRKWRFGDGDSLLGNVVLPEHTYAQTGTYNACLTTRTAGGCEKTTCKTIVLQNPATSCHASFSMQLPGSNYVGQPIVLSSAPSIVSAGDSIIQRLWTFGDGTTSVGVNTTHIYTQPGQYRIYLSIQSLSGCHDSTSVGLLVLPVPTPHCEAVYTIENINTPPVGSNPALHYVRFNSSSSHGSTATDSIISRIWNFGDSTPNLQGNQINPLHGYTQASTHNACLYILTQSGCRDTVCHTVYFAPTTVACYSQFTTTATGLTVVFNSSTTIIAPGDSIISRSWTFGDGTSASNAVVLTHQYANIGEYQICLTIRTRLGCLSTLCKRIAVINQPGNCIPYFTKEQTAASLRTIRFNSIAAYSQIPNDSIIERKWEFGDGQVLNGNVINPLHTYLHGGTYNVCLFIRTLHCDKRWCQPVLVRPMDSTNITDSIQIINLYPVPVTTQLNAVIHSSHTNTAAELAIYDVYGVKKWSQNTTLPLGNSTYNILTSQLANGPYIFRVTTIYGVKGRNFYKLN